MNVVTGTVLKWVSTFGHRIDDIWDLSDGVVFAEVFHKINADFQGSTLQAAQMMGNWVCATNNIHNLYNEIDAFFAMLLPYDSHLRFLPFVDTVGIAKKECRQSVLVTAQLGMVAMCRMTQEDRVKCLLGCLNHMTPLEAAVMVVLVEQFWLKCDKLYNHMTKDDLERATDTKYLFLDVKQIVELAKQKVAGRDAIPYNDLDSVFHNAPRKYGIEVLLVDAGRKNKKSALLDADMLDEFDYDGGPARSQAQMLQDQKLKRQSSHEHTPEESGNPLLSRLALIKSPISSSVEQICSRLRSEDLYAKKRYLGTASAEADAHEHPKGGAQSKDTGGADNGSGHTKQQPHQGGGDDKKTKGGEGGAPQDDIYTDIINRTMKDSVRDSANNILAHNNRNTAAGKLHSQAYLQQLQLQMWIFAHRKRSRKKYALDDYVPPHLRLNDENCKYRGKPIPSSAGQSKGIMHPDEYKAAAKDLKKMKRSAKKSIFQLVNDSRKSKKSDDEGTPTKSTQEVLEDLNDRSTGKEYIFHTLWHSYSVASARTPTERYKLARAMAKKRKVQQFMDAIEQANNIHHQHFSRSTTTGDSSHLHQEHTYVNNTTTTTTTTTTTSTTLNTTNNNNSSPVPSSNHNQTAASSTQSNRSTSVISSITSPTTARSASPLSTSTTAPPAAAAPQQPQHDPPLSHNHDPLHLSDVEMDDHSEQPSQPQGAVSTVIHSKTTPSTTTPSRKHKKKKKKSHSKHKKHHHDTSSTSGITTTDSSSRKPKLFAQEQMDRWLQCKNEKYNTADHHVLASHIAKGAAGVGKYADITKKL